MAEKLSETDAHSSVSEENEEMTANATEQILPDESSSHTRLIADSDVQMEDSLIMTASTPTESVEVVGKKVDSKTDETDDFVEETEEAEEEEDEDEEEEAVEETEKAVDLDVHGLQAGSGTRSGASLTSEELPISRSSQMADMTEADQPSDTIVRELEMGVVPDERPLNETVALDTDVQPVELEQADETAEQECYIPTPPPLFRESPEDLVPLSDDVSPGILVNKCSF